MDAHERIYSAEEPVSFDPLGLYIVRGDNISMIGSIDEDRDGSVDYKNIRADPLPPIRH